MKQKLKNYSNFIIWTCWLLAGPLYALEYTPKDKIKSFIGNYDSIKVLKIKDTISKEKNNIELKQYYLGKKLKGYERHIETTTGCNSKCLPIIYSAFYDAKGNYIDLYSKEGLTKKYHIPFSAEDLSKLNLILVMAPKVFDEVAHPEQMTDAISRATLKKYTADVVDTAAYSTLRIHLYNQETIKYIKELEN